ncbi:hypothetical protein B9Z65_5438 [Elsinoe australis]|uniref:Apple domain-containing protein n=1 Tax=Elsinoe australis TaxID=40998 RepID=A0A2P7ZE32_9PEZI|nr:hypothetical protein B9Z65_5438 [Elsinoe australis]
MKATTLLALVFLQSTVGAQVDAATTSSIIFSTCNVVADDTSATVVPSTTTTFTLTDPVYKFTTTPTIVGPAAKTITNTRDITVWRTAATPSTTTILSATTALDCRYTYSVYVRATLPVSTITVPAAFKPASSALYATTKSLTKLQRRAVPTPARKNANVATVTCAMLTVMVAPASTSTLPDVTQTVTRTVLLTPAPLIVFSRIVDTTTVSFTSVRTTCTADGTFMSTVTTATVTPAPSALACGANNMLDRTAKTTTNVLGNKVIGYTTDPIVGLTFANGVDSSSIQGPASAAECCTACWLDSKCLGSTWAQPNGRCAILRSSSGAIGTISAGKFYNLKDAQVGLARTYSYSNGSSIVLSNGPAGYWGDASGYI